MNRLHFTIQASRDLDEIHDYIAEQSPKAALRLITLLEKRCYRVARTPGIGRRREELAPSLRSVVEGKYIIFYRPVEDGIEIVRVLHGARDIAGIFEPKDDNPSTEEEQ